MSATDGSGEDADESVDRSGDTTDDVDATADGARTVEELSDRSRSVIDRLPFADDRVLQALVGIVLVGLVLRLLFLGDRVAHFDEGRVAYWATYTLDTGSFAYRRITHGPLIQHVDRWLFGLLGANDFTMRLPVAIVGALLPLSALLFREHLRRLEVVLMGAFLAFNPVLLYYSRFLRSDLLVAAFMFVAMGLVVRYYDTRQSRYLYLASAATALGFGSKENAIVYVAVWVGATALLADQALHRPRESESGASLLFEKGRALRARLFGSDGRPGVTLLAVAGHAFWIAVIFLAISVFIYAPRGAGFDGLYHPPLAPSEGALGLWQAFPNPVALYDVSVATADHTIGEFMEWFGSASDPGCHKDNVIDGWACYFGRFLEVLATKAAPLSAFALVGFVYERYGSPTTRNAVMFMTYAGVVAIFGYPLGTDVWGSWLAVHAIVPLSIPAAVGLGLIFRWGHEAFVDDDQVGVTIAAVLVLLVAAVSGAVVLQSVYVNDQSDGNNVVQYAQPGGEAKPALQVVETVSDSTEGPHVLVYYGQSGDRYAGGDSWVQRNEAEFNRSALARYPMCMEFFNSLPMGWYIAQDDVDVACERDEGDLRSRLNGDPPPIVLTQYPDSTVPERALANQYVERTYEWRTYGSEASFWIREDYAGSLPDQ